MQIQHLCILLTFGIACPLLSVISCAATCTTTLLWQYIIVWYVNFPYISKIRGERNKISGKRTKIDDGGVIVSQLSSEVEYQLEMEFTSVWKGARESTFVILGVCCLFYAFVLADIAGDASPADAFGVLVFCLLFPFVLWIYYRLVIRKVDIKRVIEANSDHSTGKAPARLHSI